MEGNIEGSSTLSPLDSASPPSSASKKRTIDDVDKGHLLVEPREESKKRIKAERRQQHKQNRKQKKHEKKQSQDKKVDEEGVVTTEMLEEAVYSFSPGLRRVEPFEYTFKVFAKQRWQGMSLIDLFVNEFPHLPKHIYERKINRGDITINGVKVSPLSRIRQHDFITHKVHRHEPPVTSERIKIIFMNEDIVVVDKPASIPVHPCGRYRHNSVTFILAHENQLTKLYGVHRLDRLTSGLLMLTRNSALAGVYGKQISSGQVHKQYIARVTGEFPSDEVTVDQPIKVVNQKLGLNTVSPDGKPCTTIFKRKSYDPVSNTSIVFCRPLTGRTHQIRIHLKWLGHPIANDPLYNDDPAVNRLKSFTSDGYVAGDGEDGDMFGEAEAGSSEVANNNQATSNNETTTTTSSGEGNDNSNSNSNVSDSGSSSSSSSSNIEQFDIKQECVECKNPKRDPIESEMLLYLHAYAYEGPEWKYETEFPSWAL